MLGLEQTPAASQWGKDKPMTISMHEASVGFFVPFLRNLSGLLDHAARHAEARKIEPSVLLKMRLSANMYDFCQQVGEVNRHAVVACALLAGRDPLAFPATEADIPELKSRVARAVEYVQDLPREEIEAGGDRDVMFRYKNGSERKFTGRSLLLTLSIPQFFFHLTTAYDILRHAGVEIVKKDFLGPRPY
jgi:hypothetical protein